MTNETSKEFRNVHSARAYLKIYVDSGRNLETIRDIPINEIERFDVWQCIFEKEPEAYRELCIKEWYYTFLHTPEDESVKELKLLLIVSRLIRCEEWNTPFTTQDGIDIILDCYGTDYLPLLIEKVKESADLRKEIVKPYFKPDHEWVGYADRVLEKLKTYE